MDDGQRRDTTITAFTKAFTKITMEATQDTFVTVAIFVVVVKDVIVVKRCFLVQVGL